MSDTDSRPNSIDQSVSQRLRNAVDDAGHAPAVAERAGIPVRSLNRYLNGREMRASVLVAVARACGVTVDWLVTGTEAWQPGEPAHYTLEQDGRTVSGNFHRVSSPIATKGGPKLESDLEIDPKLSFIPIPRYEVKASAGMGIAVMEENRMGYVALEEAFLRRVVNRKQEHLVSIEASGDSMDPTIRDGDLLIIDTSVTVIESSRVYVIDVGGRLLVKRVQPRLDGSLLIKSDNPKYEAETLIPSEQTPLRVIGEVVYQAGPVRS